MASEESLIAPSGHSKASLGSAPAPGRFEALACGAIFVAVVALWLLSRPFQGIVQDGRIYLMRILADLDPMGLGRDMMFQYDGQSQFSLFRHLSSLLVNAVGLETTACFFSVANILIWLLAAFFFTGHFSKGRQRLAILMIAAVVPSNYGALNVFRFAEQFAIPRPLAEACVLIALGFLVQERRFIAFIWLLLAATLHPIMALPGLFVFYLDLCRVDRRWGLVFFAGIGVAIFGNLPFSDRLRTVIDPEWMTVLRVRNFYLFPTEWAVEAYALIALQFASIAVATHFVSARVKSVFIMIACGGLLGVLISTILGDLWPILFVAQVQLWRALWLVAVAAVFGFTLCLLQIGRCEHKIEFAILCLSIGWLFTDQTIVMLIVSCAALILMVLPARFFSGDRKLLNIIWALVIAIEIALQGRALLEFIGLISEAPVKGISRLSMAFGLLVFLFPVAIFAVVWTRSKGFLHIAASVLAAVTLGVTLGLFWDDRPAVHRLIDSGKPPVDLAKLLPDDKSEIYWIESTEPELLTGHPGWAQSVQGAGIVFSRQLGILWHTRVDRLQSLHLANRKLFDPWTTEHQTIPQLTKQSVELLCAFPDAPSTIIAPIEDNMAAPNDLRFQTWIPPVPFTRLDTNNDDLKWRVVKSFIIVSCSDYKPQPKGL